jgi:hypothetical protein
MWLDNESQDAVDLFWQLAGEIEPFPRLLERPALIGLPIAIVKLPRLALRDIERWLISRNIFFSFNCQDRLVRGCLIAFKGKGIILVDGTDPIDEIRFTIAHEIAHFMLEYWLPRNQAEERFGSAIIDVMDGIRKPTVSERLYALLDGTQIGVHTDLMDRNSQNGSSGSETWKIENRADRVSLGLLAPVDNVLAQVDLDVEPYQQRKENLVKILVPHFGLPAYIAEIYAADLLASLGKGPFWTESLRFA